jgi:hypothetical protein
VSVGIRSWYDSRPGLRLDSRRKGGPGRLWTCPCHRPPTASRAETLRAIDGWGMTRGPVRRGPRLTERGADDPMTGRAPRGEGFTAPRATPRLEAQTARVLRDCPLDRIARAVGEVGGDLDRHADRPVRVRGQDVDDFLRDLDQDGEGDAAVAVPPDRVGVGRLDRVAVAGLPVCPLAFVPIDRVVPDRRRRPGREDVGEQEAYEGAAEFEAGPPGGREEPLVAGPAPGRHNAGGSQYIGEVRRPVVTTAELRRVRNRA